MTGLEIAVLVMVIISVITAAYSIYVASRIKPPGVNTVDFDKNSIASPKEGDSIPVVFGTKRIRDANIVYYGDVRSVTIKSKKGKK